MPVALVIRVIWLDVLAHTDVFQLSLFVPSGPANHRVRILVSNSFRKRGGSTEDRRGIDPMPKLIVPEAAIEGRHIRAVSYRNKTPMKN